MAEISTEILIVVLVVVLMALLVLFWIVRLYKNRDLTELSLYSKQPLLRLAIKTKPDRAEQLLGFLLDRVFPSGEDGPNPEEREPKDSEGPSGSDPSDNEPNKTHDTFCQRFSQWIHVARPPKQDRQQNFSAESPHIPPTDQDQASSLHLQQANKSQHASSSCQGGSSKEDEQHDETHL